MCLSRREQRLLKGIDEGVCQSDPRLASMLATFSRLTVDEQMPEREYLRTLASRRRSAAGRSVRMLATRVTWIASLAARWLAAGRRPRRRGSKAGQPDLSGP